MQLAPFWNRFEETLRKRLALRRRYMSGIVSQLGDPLWHEKGLISTTDDGEGDFDVDLLMRMGAVYGQVSMVGRSFVKVRQPVEDPGEFTEEDSACCGGHKLPTLSLKLSDLLSVKVDCKAVSAEVGTKVWISPFASVKYEFDGRVTVFSGARAKLEMLGVAAKVGMKDGLYITVDRNGIQDVGGRVQFEAGWEIAPGVVASGNVETMDFSLVDSK